MIDVRSFDTLGALDFGWLDARHHFSFGHYTNDGRMGWGRLRVWNDDTIQPGRGFAPHPHKDMEIITYVREGAITHEDSMGNKGRTEAGDVQVMSAGSGVRHSEYNHEDEETRIFQIWIEPDVRGGDPAWGAKAFPKADRANEWSVLASGKGDEDALEIRADARVMGATLEPGETLTYDLEPGRSAYIALAAGDITLNGETVNARDGAAIRDVETLTLQGGSSPAEIVLADTL
ncbi:MAG: pirin family protein [Pseudomonadota bacterium]